MFIGFDDTDSKQGMCTTYIAAVLIERLKSYGKVSNPRLIRLNPTIKYKTRGNAAIAISIDTEHQKEVEEITIKTIEDLAELKEENTNPGVVFAPNVPDEIKLFSKRAVKETIRIDEAKKLISKYGLHHKGFKNKRGLIGALAAVGAEFDDFTYELITYRYKDQWGSKRNIDRQSVFKADRETYPLTWDTVDLVNKKIVFFPHSGCPVLYGIRGDEVSAIVKAKNIIKSEAFERSVLFTTNQGTDSHLISSEISEVKEGCSYILRGKIRDDPHTISGGHVIFSISDGSACIDCAAYEPTKNFRDIVRALLKDDVITAFGSVKNNTINLEKIEVEYLKDKFTYTNPKCPKCDKTMKSSGKGQKYRCKSCKTYSDEKDRFLVERVIEPGLYEVPPVARRHISKPLIREKYEKGKKVHLNR